MSFDSSTTAPTVNHMEIVGKEPEFWKKYAVSAGSREKPLFKDNYMNFFTNPETEKKVNAMGAQPLSAAVRHRYMLKSLSKSIKTPLTHGDAVKQVVILGSGYDTKAVRKEKYSKAFGVKYFEFDFPSILQHKEAVYSSNNIEKNAIYIGLDYIKNNFVDKLKENNFDFEIPTHFILEGNIMYFESKECLNNILSLIKNHFKNVFISFDYVHLAFLENRTGNKEVEEVFKRFSQRGPSWKTGLEDLNELAMAHGFSIIEDKTIAELKKEYEVDNQPNAVCSYYSVCTLSKI